MNSEYQELSDEMAFTVPSENQTQLKSQRKKIAIVGVLSFFILFVTFISNGSHIHTTTSSKNDISFPSVDGNSIESSGKSTERPIGPVEFISMEDSAKQTSTNTVKVMGLIAGGAKTSIPEIIGGNPVSYNTSTLSCPFNCFHL
jgi:hypothetical protein